MKKVPSQKVPDAKEQITGTRKKRKTAIPKAAKLKK